MCPASPEALRKETSQVYAAGWPPVFLGDLNYYLVDYDLRETAAGIDTASVGVHILSGEYDASGTMELGRAAHAMIAGSTWTGMGQCRAFPHVGKPTGISRLSSARARTDQTETRSLAMADYAADPIRSGYLTPERLMMQENGTQISRGTKSRPSQTGWTRKKAISRET